jgi:hypothetical protein
MICLQHRGHGGAVPLDASRDRDRPRGARAHAEGGARGGGGLSYPSVSLQNCGSLTPNSRRRRARGPSIAARPQRTRAPTRDGRRAEPQLARRRSKKSLQRCGWCRAGLRAASRRQATTAAAAHPAECRRQPECDARLLLRPPEAHLRANGCLIGLRRRGVGRRRR